MNFHQPLNGWSWGGNRMDLAVRLAIGKSVLHVGCCDSGMTGRETLHQKLGKVSKSLVGLDVPFEPNTKTWEVDREGILRLDFQHSEWHKELGDFDLVLCTEVLEHVGNVADFLKNLRSVGAQEYLFTVPNAFCTEHWSHIVQNGPLLMGHGLVPWGNEEHSELVHPDHNCWYSPYTLENTLRKAGYIQIEKWMVGWKEPKSLFAAEGVAILAK